MLNKYLLKNCLPSKFNKQIFSNINKLHICNKRQISFNINKQSKAFVKIIKFTIVDKNKNNFENPEEMNNRILMENEKIKSEDQFDSDEEDPQSFYNRRKRLMYLITIASAVIVIVYIALLYIKPDTSVPASKRFGQTTYVGTAQIGGPWKLIDTDGEIFTHNDLKGKYYFIYFGFTQCPDVCPMSLQKLAKVFDKLRKSNEFKYFDIECVFVSIDPDRDSLERLKTYKNLFNENFIALTANSNDEIKEVLKTFKIYSSKIYMTKEDEEEDKKLLKKLEETVPQLNSAMDAVKPKNDSKYSLDHTTVTYLMSPDNKFLSYLSANSNPDEMYNMTLEAIMNDLSKQIRTIPREKNR